MRKSAPLRQGLLLAWSLVTLLPLLWLLLTSLKPSMEIFLHPFALPVPGQLAWGNYARAWEVSHFRDYLFNSLAVTLMSTLGTVYLGAMVAYPLARFHFPGSKWVRWALLAGLAIPLQLAAVPLFFQLRAVGLLDSRLGLTLVYIATGLPFAVFVLGGFFRAIPDELYDSARLDGCTEWQAFRQIMLPLASPGLVTVAIFTALSIYNEYFLAFLFLSGKGSEALRTLPLGLANLTIVSQYRTDYGQLFAGTVMVMVPMLIFYLLVERRIAQGVAAGAVKG